MDEPPGSDAGPGELCQDPQANVWQVRGGPHAQARTHRHVQNKRNILGFHEAGESYGSDRTV